MYKAKKIQNSHLNGELLLWSFQDVSQELRNFFSTFSRKSLALDAEGNVSSYFIFI